MRNLLWAGVATVALAAVGYYTIPRGGHPVPVAETKDATSRAGEGTSEASEAGADVRPVPDVPDPMRGVVESIVIERPTGASVEDEVVVVAPGRPLTFTEPAAEHMVPAPHPDAARGPMPMADEATTPVVAEEAAPAEVAVPVEPAPVVDYHRQHPSCPRSGVCPVPHVSYPLPNRSIER